ncbi:nickel pincer cofactor biosynthesis protein LarC [Staphylococcus sp. mip270_02]|uniref:nickel pincer cofactor biosynthesis protein LarC n=2 Tax=Staphylococcus xylosus TaxID=1288 RepID=UPI000349CE98|nr:nickel pincer cofactor biosynthesis protein LarC [Staphylococcus xylosus]MBF0812611.1 nickel pincer cofactor biosynthesis protein LarC [Staphylococcus saprophyticus]TFV25560.1 nickel pincer cofactor biosynthesis protein LarC [Staphylococcus saprophyticus]
MPNAIYLDCHAGIAGDMLLSALVDLGADINYIEKHLNDLPLNKFKLNFSSQNKQGIQATSLSIDFEPAHHHRKAQDIFLMINESTLPDRVKERSIHVFDVIAHAEAKIHGMSVENVHFHEVGAMDSIIDIIGSCLALENLDIDTILSSPIPTGHGKINIAHGIYPVPAPATAEILKGIPLAAFDVASELTTPTGAGFIKALVSEIGTLPSVTISNIGYGCGSKDFDFPNILRAIQFSKKEATPSQVQVLECQLDDMTPEMLGFFMEQVIDDGALDAYYTPITMKKSRPATQLTVICSLSQAQYFENYILKYTTSLGVRSFTVNRKILHRQFQTVHTDYGAILVKLGMFGDKVIKAKPEFEDVRNAAIQSGTPFATVYNDIQTTVQKHINIEND